VALIASCMRILASVAQPIRMFMVLSQLPSIPTILAVILRAQETFCLDLGAWEFSISINFILPKRTCFYINALLSATLPRDMWAQ
jgi:hypothetical protein